MVGRVEVVEERIGCSSGMEDMRGEVWMKGKRGEHRKL